MNGEGEIEIDYSFDKEEDGIDITVADFGPGFTDEQLKQINQGQRIASSKKQGHGIGLLTVLLLIRQLNGEAKFSVRDGGGSIVYLWIPSTPRDDDNHEKLENYHSEINQ
jgi:signal transduction histidine kinase